MNNSAIKENVVSKTTKNSVPKRAVPAQPVDLPKNSSAHVAKINTDIEAVELTEKTLVSHLKDCRAILDQIKDKADHSTEDLNKTLMEIFQKVNLGFTTQVQNQIKENEKMQQKVEKLKQEKNDLQKIVVECSKRCSQLEEDLGRYPS